MDSLLYHYTSEAGLTGIIGSDNIRATHIRFLNDWMEFREAFTQSYVRILLDSFRAGLPSDLAPDACRVMDGMLSRRAREILEIAAGSESANETFVCSFTSASPQESGDPGDQLSQWRGYSAGTQGFSLGFDRELLRERVEINNPKAKAILEQCVYDDAEKTSFFREIGRLAAARFDELQRNNQPAPSSFVTIHPNPTDEYKKTNYYFLESLSRATARLFTTAARIKNTGFREEREWRVIFQATKDALSPIQNERGRIEIVKFRDGQFGRTPYIEISLGLADADKSPLRRIVVGPGAYKEEKKRYVELLLLNRGIEPFDPGKDRGVRITTSAIPYRTG
jgi:hypothetical protein